MEIVNAPNEAAGTYKFTVSPSLQAPFMLENCYAEAVQDLWTGKAVEINMPARFEMKDAKIHGFRFNSTNNFYARGSDFRLNLYCYNNVDLLNCNVYGMLNGISIYNGKQLKIHLTTFHDAELYIYDCQTDLRYLNFPNYGGITAEAMTYPTTCYSCNITSAGSMLHATGIDYSGTSASPLILLSGNIINQEVAGVEIEGSPLIPGCGSIKYTTPFPNSNVAVHMKANSELILDPSIDWRAGKMNMSGYRTTIYSNNGNDLRINNGYSELSAQYQPQASVLSGNIITQYPAGMLAEHNLWDRNGYYMPMRLDHYHWFYDGRGGPSFYDFIGQNNYLTTTPNYLNLCALEAEDDDPLILSKKGAELKYDLPVKGLEQIGFKSGINLQEEMKTIFTADEAENKEQFHLQLNRQISLLRSDLPSNPIAEEAKTLTYQKMLRGVGAAAEKGLIEVKQDNLSNEMANVISIQNEMLSKVSSDNTARKFTICMDIAGSYRLAAQLYDAQNTLNKAAGFASAEQMYLVDKWLCQLENEIMLKEGKITIIEFTERISSCKFENAPEFPSAENQFEINALSSTDLNSTDLEVFPNPAVSEISIKMNDQAVVGFEILDIQGKVVLKGKTGTGTINLDGCSQGVYMLKLEYTDKVSTHRLVKM